MVPLSNWTHNVTDIPETGLSREKAANAKERDDIADSQKLVSLESFVARYRIDRLAGGAYRLSGSLKAECYQACVVTLEPVPTSLEDTFDTEFWPDHVADDDAGEMPVLGGRDVETLENGVIEVGRIVYETFAAALDPYPRKPGAHFDWSDKTAQGTEKSNPFAVLSKLKDKS